MPPLHAFIPADARLPPQPPHCTSSAGAPSTGAACADVARARTRLPYKTPEAESKKDKPDTETKCPQARHPACSARPCGQELSAATVYSRALRPPDWSVGPLRGVHMRARLRGCDTSRTAWLQTGKKLRMKDLIPVKFTKVRHSPLHYPRTRTHPHPPFVYLSARLGAPCLILINPSGAPHRRRQPQGAIHVPSLQRNLHQLLAGEFPDSSPTPGHFSCRRSRLISGDCCCVWRYSPQIVLLRPTGDVIGEECYKLLVEPDGAR